MSDVIVLSNTSKTRTEKRIKNMLIDVRLFTLLKARIAGINIIRDGSEDPTIPRIKTIFGNILYCGELSIQSL